MTREYYDPIQDRTPNGGPVREPDSPYLRRMRHSPESQPSFSDGSPVLITALNQTGQGSQTDTSSGRLTQGGHTPSSQSLNGSSPHENILRPGHNGTPRSVPVGPERQHLGLSPLSDVTPAMAIASNNFQTGPNQLVGLAQADENRIFDFSPPYHGVSPTNNTRYSPGFIESYLAAARARPFWTNPVHHAHSPAAAPQVFHTGRRRSLLPEYETPQTEDGNSLLFDDQGTPIIHPRRGSLHDPFIHGGPVTSNEPIHNDQSYSFRDSPFHHGFHPVVADGTVRDVDTRSYNGHGPVSNGPRPRDIIPTQQNNYTGIPIIRSIASDGVRHPPGYLVPRNFLTELLGSDHDVSSPSRSIARTPLEPPHGLPEPHRLVQPRRIGPIQMLPEVPEFPSGAGILPRPRLTYIPSHELQGIDHCSPEDIWERVENGVSINYEGNASLARNHSENIPEELNCSFWVTGLSPDLTHRELLSAIRDMGRLYAVVINKPAGSHQTSAAKVIFFDLDAAQRFHAETTRHGFVVGGYRGHVSKNRIKTSAKDQEGPRDKSRVLVIKGAVSHANPEFLSALFGSKFKYELDEVVIIEQTPLLIHLEFRFGSYRCQAEAAFQVLRREYLLTNANPTGPIWSVRWGKDPCDIVNGNYMPSFPTYIASPHF